MDNIVNPGIVRFLARHGIELRDFYKTCIVPYIDNVSKCLLETLRYIYATCRREQGLRPVQITENDTCVTTLATLRILCECILRFCIAEKRLFTSSLVATIHATYVADVNEDTYIEEKLTCTYVSDEPRLDTLDRAEIRFTFSELEKCDRYCMRLVASSRYVTQTFTVLAVLC